MEMEAQLCSLGLVVMFGLKTERAVVPHFSITVQFDGMMIG